KLVIVTQSPKEFLKFKIELEDLQNYFSQIISTIDDIKMHKKQEGTYEEVLKILNVKPEEIIHIGDSFNSDYLAPRKAGIFSLYLDRKKQRTGEGIIYSLEEIKKYL
ncbi:MAG: HAD family hydrolase, partial [Nanoarchaeota archaeon]|nr:HAD family hydrolase [Nanoarchaeota archaeon]